MLLDTKELGPNHESYLNKDTKQGISGYAPLRLRDYITQYPEGEVPEDMENAVENSPDIQLIEFLGVPNITVFNITDRSVLSAIDYYGLSDAGKMNEELSVIRDRLILGFNMLGSYPRSLKERSRLVTLNQSLAMIAGFVRAQNFTIQGDELVQDTLGKFVLFTAGKYLMHKRVREMRQLLKKADAESQTRDVLDNFQFNYANTITTKFAGLSLIDIIDTDPTQIPPAQLLAFFVEAHLTTKGKPLEDAVAQNLGHLGGDKYPQLVIDRIIKAPREIISLEFLDDEWIDTYPLPQNVLNPELKQTIKMMIGKVDKCVESIHHTLLHPTSKEFVALKKMIEGYMSLDEIARKVALHTVIVGSDDHVKQLYRFAQQQVSEGGEYSSFYAKLIEPIREVAESPKGFGLLTSEAAPSFLRGERLESDISATVVGDLELLSLGISQKTRDRQFAITDPDFDLGDLLTPYIIVVRISKNQPKQFSVNFIYKNDDGESERITFDVNSKLYPNGFDWSIIEYPSELPEMHQAIVRAARATLLYLSTNIDKEKANKALNEVKPIPYSPTKKLSLLVAPAPAEVKTKVKTRGVPEEQNIDSGTVEPEVVPSRKASISVGDQDDFRKQLARLSSEDQVNVYEAIEAFNERGVGRFYMMKQRGPQGQIRYILRTKATMRGGIRVIVEETPSEDGNRHFSTIKVGYRKDVYR